MITYLRPVFNHKISLYTITTIIPTIIHVILLISSIASVNRISSDLNNIIAIFVIILSGIGLLARVLSITDSKCDYSNSTLTLVCDTLSQTINILISLFGVLIIIDQLSEHPKTDILFGAIIMMTSVISIIISVTMSFYHINNENSNIQKV